MLEELEEIAGELGASGAQVALAWLLRKPAVTSVIFGARAEAQLDENLKAAALALPDEAMARLDEVSRVDPGYPCTFIGRVQRRW